jgi:hypothetical protein
MSASAASEETQGAVGGLDAGWHSPQCVKAAALKLVAFGELPPSSGIRAAILAMPARLTRAAFLEQARVLLLVIRAEEEATAVVLQHRLGLEHLHTALLGERRRALGIDPNEAR